MSTVKFITSSNSNNKLCGRPAQYAPAQACNLTISSYLFARWHLLWHAGYLNISNKLTFDILTLKVVSESRVTWATYVPILVFLDLSVLDLGPMYATDVKRQMDVRQTDVRQHHRLMPPGRGHNDNM